MTESAKTMLELADEMRRHKGATLGLNGQIKIPIEFLDQCEAALRRTAPADVRKAFKPFADFMDTPIFQKLSDDTRLTAGSPMARRQLMVGDLRKLSAALTSAPADVRAALEPFAKISLWRDTYPDAKDDTLTARQLEGYINVEDVRRARSVLASTIPDDQRATEDMTLAWNVRKATIEEIARDCEIRAGLSSADHNSVLLRELAQNLRALAAPQEQEVPGR